MSYKGTAVYHSGVEKPDVASTFKGPTWMDCIADDLPARVIVNTIDEFNYNREQCIAWISTHFPEPEPEPVEVIITKPKTKYRPVRKVEG